MPPLQCLRAYDTAMQFGNCSVIPAKSEHAVVGAVFVLELAARISEEKIKAIATAYRDRDDLKVLLPKLSRSENFSMRVTPGAATRPTSGSRSLRLERFAPDGNPVLELSVGGEAVMFTSNDYQRWSIDWPQAREVFTWLVPYLTPAPGIRVFGLQYVDEFYINGEVNAFRGEMLFKDGLLPTQLLTKEGRWHCHTGWFDPGPQGGERLLTNANINVLARGDRHVVQITTAQRFIQAAAIQDAHAAGNRIANAFDELHVWHKQVLRRLLTTQAQESIHLEPSDA